VRRSITGKQVLKGRGALSNPPGRFDLTRLESVDDGWYLEESPDSIATTLEPERSRSVITTNDSPDVPFEQSINPYRGCEHACSYCGHGETPILMADGRTRRLADLRVGDEIYGTRRTGFYRHYIKSRVLAHWSVIKPAFRTTLADGTELITSGDHRFLTERGWKFVTGTEQGHLRRPHLTTANKLMGVGAFSAPPPQDADYRTGYLCALIRGDGMLGHYSYPRRAGGGSVQNHFRLALCDEEALNRAQAWLRLCGVGTRRFEFVAAAGGRRAMQAIRTQAREPVQRVEALISWPNTPTRSWQAGFLAGIFDAEGSYSSGILRISNTDARIIDEIANSLRAFGFKYVVEHVHHDTRKPVNVVRLLGGLREALYFFHTTDPAITRKRDISGQAVKSRANLRVVSIEPLKTMRLYDITTGSGDFIANGVISHNCYARPSHAYLGLSPGLDFETRLFYKADAARLLEGELSKPGYVCKPITLGANTDPYQPVERRAKVTRSVLEVLARTRHPVTIITKSALVLRDLDLLAEMARQGLACVGVSITSLDADLKRKLEPRAASPQARLRTLQGLHAAGVPCGVLVAPVIPVLTDHEMESILEAAAAAGAGWAGYVLLRLPYEIKDLFTEWLAEHYPERAAHVMSVVRAMRGGRDNDPNFGSRMRGTGPYAELLRGRFKLACTRLKFATSSREGLRTTLFRPPGPQHSQLSLDV
jgi:DNA repair photolyase